MRFEGFFKPNQLRKIPWQYQVRHEHTLNFNIGEEVFLKSNPDYPMKVVSVTPDLVWCRTQEDELEHFLPQTILQYKWAGLKQNDQTGFKICLN